MLSFTGMRFPIIDTGRQTRWGIGQFDGYSLARSGAYARAAYSGGKLVINVNRGSILVLGTFVMCVWCGA